jgi:peptidoglycan hydrolase CwlO-like protein
MNNELLLILSNTLTGFAGWFVGRKRQQADTDNAILDNLSKSIGVYQTIIEDLKKEIHELNLKVVQLESKVNELMAENKKLKTKYKTGIKTTE